VAALADTLLHARLIQLNRGEMDVEKNNRVALIFCLPDKVALGLAADHGLVAEAPALLQPLIATLVSPPSGFVSIRAGV